MREFTIELLAKLKQDCLDVAQDYEADPDDVLSLIAEVERLRARDAEWQQKAASWMSTPEAAQRLDGYRELAAKVERAEAEVERLREKCDELTINGFSAQLKQLDELRKENARLKDVVAGYSGSGQRIQDLSDDCGLLEECNKKLIAEVERLRGERAWRPIDTAPRDGTEVLLLVGPADYAEVRLGWHNTRKKRWDYFEHGNEDGVDYCREHQALMWMPLPKAADAAGGGG